MVLKNKLQLLLCVCFALGLVFIARHVEAAGSVVLSTCENPYVWSCGAPPPSKVTVTVDSKDPVEGKASIKVDYDVKAGVDNGWMYCNVKVPADKRDWTKHKTLSFYLKGDGSDNGIRIGMADAEGELFVSQQVFDMKNTKWQKYTVNLAVDENGFAPGPFYQPNKDKLQSPGVLDLKEIKELSINIEDNWMNAKKGFVNIDQIELQ